MVSREIVIFVIVVKTVNYSWSLRVTMPFERQEYEKELTRIPVKKPDHRLARETKRDGESWSLWIRRAAKALDDETEN